MKTKKLLTIILTLAMSVSLLPMTVSVSAEETQEKRISEFIRPELVSDDIDAGKLTNISSSAKNSMFVNPDALQGLDKTLLAGDSLERITYTPNDTETLDKGYGEWQNYAPFDTNTGSYEFTMMIAKTQKGVPVKVREGEDGKKQFKFIGWGDDVYSSAGVDLIIDVDSNNKCTVKLQRTGAVLSNGAELLIANYSYLKGGVSTGEYDEEAGTFTLNDLCYCYFDGPYLFFAGPGCETMAMNNARNSAGKINVTTDNLGLNTANLISNKAVVFYVTDADGYYVFRITSKNAAAVGGEYNWADGGIDYLNSYFINSGSNEQRYFMDGSFTVTTNGDDVTLEGYVIGEDNIKYNLNWSYTAPKFGEWEDFDPNGKTGKYLFTAMFDNPVYQKDIPVKVREDMDGNKQIKFVGWGKDVLTNGGGIDLIVEMDKDGKCTVPIQNTGRFWPEYGKYIMVQDYTSLIGGGEPCYYDSQIGRFQLNLCYVVLEGSDLYGYSKLENMEIRKNIPDSERTNVNIESNALGYNDAYLESDNAVIFYAADVPGFEFFRVTSNNTNVVDGTYKWSKGGISDINSYFIEKGSQVEGYFQDGEFTVKTEGETVTLTGYMIGEDEKLYNLNLSGVKPEPQEEPDWSEWEDFAPNGLDKGRYFFSAAFNPPIIREDITVKVRTDEDGNKQFKFVDWGKDVFVNGGDLIVNMDKDGKCTVPKQNTGEYLSLYSADVMVQDYASLTGGEPSSFYDADINVFQLNLCYYLKYGATLLSCGMGFENMRMTTDRDTVDIADGTLEYDASGMQSDKTAVFYATDIPGYGEFRIATKNTTAVEGTYKWSNGGIDAENSYLIEKGSQDKVYFCGGEFTVKVYNNAAWLTGWLYGTDGKIYKLDMHDKISLTLDGSSFTVTQSGKNKGKGVIIVALYDSVNTAKLLDVKTYNIANTDPIKDSFDANNGYVKAMWWSNLDVMTPFCSPVSETIVR